MKFPSQHPTLSASDLVLKKVSSEDLKELEEIVSYRQNNELTAQQLLDKMNQSHLDRSAINWGIYVDNELIGTVGFYRGFEFEIGEIGYVTREKYRNKGFTTKGISRVIEYGLKEMKLVGIVAYTSESNLISKAILNKLNFNPVKTTHQIYVKYELVQSQHLPFNKLSTR